MDLRKSEKGASRAWSVTLNFRRTPPYGVAYYRKSFRKATARNFGSWTRSPRTLILGSCLSPPPPPKTLPPSFRTLLLFHPSPVSLPSPEVDPVLGLPLLVWFKTGSRRRWTVLWAPSGGREEVWGPRRPSSPSFSTPLSVRGGATTVVEPALRPRPRTGTVRSRRRP